MLLLEILDGCYIDISSQTYGNFYSKESLEDAIDQMGIKFILKDIDSVKIGEL